MQVPRVNLPIIAKTFLEDVDKRGSNQCTASLLAQWSYQTNLTEENREAQVNVRCCVLSWIQKFIIFIAFILF